MALSGDTLWSRSLHNMGSISDDSPVNMYTLFDCFKHYITKVLWFIAKLDMKASALTQAREKKMIA